MASTVFWKKALTGLNKRAINEKVSSSAALCLLMASGSLMAGSKVIATGGATTVEGNSGGGIVPWATINGYSSSDEWSVNTFAGRVGVDDFTLDSVGIGASFNNQWDLSFARAKIHLGYHRW